MLEIASPLFAPVQWEKERFKILDETRLPWETDYITVSEVGEAVQAVREMKTRAFGQVLTFLYAGALAARRSKARNPENVLGELDQLAEEFSKARPTFNFKKHLGFFADALRACPTAEEPGPWLEGKIHERVETILRARDQRAHRTAALLPDNCRLMTHCNVSGELVAVGRHMSSMGKKLSVIATETRPYLQGSRLTAWELARAGIDVALIPDCGVAQVMARGEIDVVLVGSDRCARNGDIINKVGTYSIALAAREYRVPFYVLAQDPGLLASGQDVPIEERPAAELLSFQGCPIVPQGVAGRYPAFDVTPAALVSKLISYDGVFTPAAFREKYDQPFAERKGTAGEKKRFLMLFGIPRSEDYGHLSETLKDERAESILVPEMRPQLWGARWVSARLVERGIPTTLISDNMMGTLLSREDIRGLFVFYERVDERGPVGLCGSLLATLLARLHGAPIKLLESGKAGVQAVDETVGTFMGRKVCAEGAVPHLLDRDVVPWALFGKN